MLKNPTFCASCGDCIRAPSGEVAEACGELRDITLNGELISRTDMPGLATAPPGLLVYRATTGPLSGNSDNGI